MTASIAPPPAPRVSKHFHAHPAPLPHALPVLRVRGVLGSETYPLSRGTAQILPAAAVPLHLLAQTDLASQVCDHRYYDIVHRTLAHDFPLHYILLHDKAGDFKGAQPFFIAQQNILAGMPGKIAHLAAKIRAHYPAFLTLKTLMLGNPAGPAILAVKSHASPAQHSWFAAALAETLALYARRHKIRILVFKDFPALNRPAMTRLTDSSAADAASAGFIRLPSMPMTSLDLTPYASFEGYMNKTLSKITRKGLRRKFKKTADENIQLTITNDIADCADEIHSLYLQVYNRAALKFEKITPDYLRQLSHQMPDRARFFLWRQPGTPTHPGKLLAASITLVRFPNPHRPPNTPDDSALYDLYLGMDYPLALELSLYHLTMRDVIQWSIDNKIATYFSTPLNYDAKLHFRHRLVPQDLYLRHTSPILNPAFQFAMRFAQPTRHDKILPQFPNVSELEGPP